MTNELSVEKAIDVLYTIRAYYASMTAGYPKGKDCIGIGDVMCSEIANSCLMAIKALEQQPISWIIGKDNCQVAVRNMPIDKMQKICAIIGIGEEELAESEDEISRNNLAITSQDCISREDAIRIAEQGQIQGYEWQFKKLRNLPSVTPQPKRGKWIEDAETYYKMLNERGLGVDEYTPYFTDDIACSVCLAKYSCIDNETQFFKYCPNCGADMRESEG